MSARPCTPSSSPHMELQPLSSASRSTVDAAQMLSVPQISPARKRFQALVNRIIRERRACTVFQQGTRSYSLDQGIDPRNERAERRFAFQKVKCAIEVTHYSRNYCRTSTYNNRELVEWLREENFPARKENEVRWINVGGISWDVIKALAIRYNLHPLSVEDVMTGARDRSYKVDYYQQHLFAQLTSYRLRQGRNKDVKAAAKQLKAKSAGVFYFTGRAKDHRPSNNVVPIIQAPDVEATNAPTTGQPRSLKSQSSTLSELGKSTLSVVQPTTSGANSRSSVEDVVQALKLQSGALNIDTTRVFVFLLKDGTLLSIHQEPTLYGTELKDRLGNQSVMRSLPDVSMLFHGFLDLVADHLIAIVDAYQSAILELERSILLKPTLLAVQSLHLISGDIRLLEMTLRPLQRIIYGLRRYDKDRYKAIAPVGEIVGRGFLCEEAIIYLADILDHVRFIMLSLGAQKSTTKELIEFTFNLTIYDSRNVMRRLLVVTVIFLPLVVITQYFGMNFEVMDSVKLHSDALFWKVVGPVLFVLILGALRNRILKVFFDTD